MSKTVKIVLKGVRSSYPHLFTPDTMSGKYTCDFLIRKDDPQMNTLREAINTVLADAKAMHPGKVINANIITDGDVDRPNDENYAGCYIIKTKTNLASIRDNVFMRTSNGLVRIDDESEFYGGCNCSASLVVSHYEFQGKFGLHFLLNGVCREEGGEAFGRNTSTASDFENEDEEVL